MRDLAEAGHQYNRKTIAGSMRRQGLLAKAAKKFKATTKSRHNLPVAPNLLQQDFTVTRPNQKYVGDITYLGTEEGWLYLAVVIDLYSRLVVGWAMSERMSAELVCDALQMAPWRRRMPTGGIVHSDRGSQLVTGWIGRGLLGTYVLEELDRQMQLLVTIPEPKPGDFHGYQA